MTDKSGLRKTFLTKRKEFGIDQIQEASAQIARRFSSFFADNPRDPVHIFLPIRKHHEIDTWPIIEFLRENSVSIVVSKSHFEDHSLSHYALEKETILKDNSWGIPEPINGNSVSAEDLQMVIVPLVIFDQTGYRVGYGKGFYDKFLAQCRDHVIMVGLSLFDPIPQISHDPHDIKMDYCITPNKTYEF